MRQHLALRQGLRFALKNAMAAALVAVICLEVWMVALRYVFSDGLIWGRDLTVLLMFSIAWLGLPLLWLERSHLAVDLLPQRLVSARAWQIMIEGVALFAALSLLVILRSAMAAFAFIELPTFGTSAAIKFWPTVVGAGLFAIAAALNLWAVLRPLGGPND